MRATVLTILLLASSVALGNPPRVLTWAALKPSALMDTQEEVAELQRSVYALGREERAALKAVQVERDALFRQRQDEPLSEAEQAALADPPSRKFPDAVAFWDKVQAASDRYAALQDDVEPTLDGQRVRIPGYVLPLEFEGDAVTEFLLVPYVGACIHEPTPGANQMVYVTTPTPFRSDGLFVPVWVEGDLNTQSGTFDLSLVDGEAPVSAAYSLQASRVERYRQ